jgi:hypothetical protein
MFEGSQTTVRTAWFGKHILEGLGVTAIRPLSVVGLADLPTPGWVVRRSLKRANCSADTGKT